MQTNFYHLIFIIFTLFCFKDSSNNKSGSIIYGKEILLDFNKNTAINIDYSKDSHLLYKLKFNSQEASFQIIKSMQDDGDNSYNISKNLGGGKGLFYFNNKTKENLRQTNAFGEDFLLTNMLADLKWKITKDTMSIGGKICYKATSTKKLVRPNKTFIRPITAWFTLDIPISYGPIGYHGLPGLILDLQIENEVRFYAKEMSFNTKETINKPSKGRKMKQREFIERGREFSLKARERYRRN